MAEKKTRRRLHTKVQKFIAACGGNTKVAKHLGLSRNAPGYWIKSDQIPASHVIELCRMTGGAYQPHMVRPDVFGPEVRV